MAILTPVNITHNNPELPTVYFSDIKGNIWATGSDGNQYGIPEGKRELGMVVYFSSSQDFKYYKGGTTASADWGSSANWSTLGGGTTYLQGPGIIIDVDNYISASIGAGLRFDDGSKIEATVRTVNGAIPDTITGNITTALTAVLTGPSASDQGGGNNLINSSSGEVTGSIANATVWVVSQDESSPDPDGLAYIFVSQSATAGNAGEWFPLSTLNQSQADLRYVRLNVGASNNQNITSSLVISGSSVTFSSSLYLPVTESMTGGGEVNTLVWDPATSQIKTTGSYGGGGGGSTPSALTFGTQTTNYTLISSDNNKVVRMNSSTNLEVYVTASNFSPGDQVIVFQSGSGQVTFIPDTTTEMLSANNMKKLRTQYSAATLTFTGNTCYLFGDIAP
jgi:hypothetical protein